MDAAGIRMPLHRFAGTIRRNKHRDDRAHGRLQNPLAQNDVRAEEPSRRWEARWNKWKGQEFETDDFVGQLRQALLNVRDVLAEAGAAPEHIVRMTWYVTDKAEYQASLAGIGAAWGEVLGKVFPAMAVVEVKGLLEDRAKIEIEATAVVPN